MSRDAHAVAVAPPPSPSEQQARADTWKLLATLLRRPPDVELLDQLTTLEQAASTSDEFGASLQLLGLSAGQCPVDAVDDEYHELFIGLGRGELVPYGSWYQTGYLMERPLAELRSDLAALGFERRDGVAEPEDHVAALAEVMAQLIEDAASPVVQRQFFQHHIVPWMARFFDDLSTARAAVFYRSVGRLGRAFIALEQRLIG